MKVSMNSQTFRVVGDGRISDYHITDGSSARHLMNAMSQGMSYVKSNVVGGPYETKDVVSEDQMFSWCGPTDATELKNINYTPVGTRSNPQTQGHQPYPGAYVAPRKIARPKRKVVKKKIYHVDNQTKENFRKLFNG